MRYFVMHGNKVCCEASAVEAQAEFATLSAAEKRAGYHVICEDDDDNTLEVVAISEGKMVCWPIAQALTLEA